MSNSVKQVTIFYDEDGMWGSEGPAGYDVGTSYQKFEEMVTKKIKEAYPEIEVDVTYAYKNVSHEVWPKHADNSKEVVDTIAAIVDEVYHSFEWATPSSDFI